MKKVFTGITAAFFILICSNLLNANPVRTTFFNELVFDSTGWKLEMSLNSGSDSLSLKGWYMVSGKDTAYFKDWMFLRFRSYKGERQYLVLTKDSLSGNLSLNMEADTLFLHSPDGRQWDWLMYGPNTNYIPSLKLNQSVCVSASSFYLDNTPTIGAMNDTSGATGGITAYVVDKAGKPASGISYLLYWEDKPFVTDSTGHFKFEHILASRYTFMFSQGEQKKYFTTYVEPWVMKEMEFQLDWVISDNNQVQGVEKKPGLGEIRYSLDQNYPNPFNPATSISYSIPKAGSVKLQVFNLLGNEVATLVNEYKNAGTHKVSFDASVLPSGVYIYTIQSGSFRNAKKMTVMK